jgi:predicted nucleic acid-binding protein
LIDTNVISEFVRPKPDVKVIQWLEMADPELLFASVVTFGEIRLGIEDLPPGKRRTALEDWLEQGVPEWFAGDCGPLGKANHRSKKEREIEHHGRWPDCGHGSTAWVGCRYPQRPRLCCNRCGNDQPLGAMMQPETEMQKNATIRVKEGNGNVFRDLGFPPSEREQLKVRLTLQIYRLIKDRGLTQPEAGRIPRYPATPRFLSDAGSPATSR